MEEKKEITIFWFKRDLRMEDNEALAAALASPLPTLLIYIYEPIIWADKHYDNRHRNFVRESLLDLNRSLIHLNTKILSVTDEVIPFFTAIQEKFQIAEVYSTAETGLQITYERDIEFAKYCKDKDILWKEFQNNGVIRGLRNRDTWRKSWYDYMNAPIISPSLNEEDYLSLGYIKIVEKTFQKLTLSVNKHNFQKGGRTEALVWQHSFFNERIKYYSQYISKPEMARYGCSRLSPYLAWGNLSIREVFQRAKRFKTESTHKKQANAFMSRLRWQSHFIQKFEQEPRMEFEAINRGFLDLEQPINVDFITAWKEGRTGYPLVDASLRCVAQTGYINFRMRSMVTSFLTHHLFQHFTTGSKWLARQFLDFEPGIHYGQMQMQAGFTGTNTVRIYNPVKNAIEHDSEAVFIKKYVPELAELPTQLAIEPWSITSMEEELYGFTYGVDYPLRIVNIQETRKTASQKLYGQRKNKLAISEKERILKTHTLTRKK